MATRTSAQPTPPKSARPAERKTVAVLVNHLEHFDGGYENQLRSAFEMTCRERDLNLLFVVGKAIDDPTEASGGALYDLVSSHWVDGVILLSGALVPFTGVEGLQRWYERHRSLPCCSVGLAVPGIPSVVVDNEPGIAGVVEHVVRQHRRRKVAFIGGPPENPEAASRLEACREALRSHGIALDPRQVRSGMFTVSSGAVAMHEILQRGVDFDAVIAANDAMALGAIEVLAARGLRVPDDVVVTGFDDIVRARDAAPPLTTVRQPLRAMAELAVRWVVDQIAGVAVPELDALPVELVTRSSCGCDGRTPTFSNPPTAARPDVGRYLRTPRVQERLGSTPRRSGSTWIQPLLQALMVEVDGQRGAFLAAVERCIVEAGQRRELYNELTDGLVRIWEEIRGSSPQLAEQFHLARHLVLAANNRAQAWHVRELESAYLNLLLSGERLATVLDRPSLVRVLGEVLPELGIRNTSVLLYGEESGVSDELLPLFCLREGANISPELSSEAAPDACPARALFLDRRYTAFVLPLASEARPWGIAVLEFPYGDTLYEMLRWQIGSALSAISLHREVVHHAQLHERSVQERSATAARMDSLSLLAGGIAHDLNNVLGPLTSLPDVLMGELPEVTGSSPQIAAEFRSDLATIKSAALRASQTIKDLLTLGRQGQTAQSPLDLNALIEAAVATERGRASNATGRVELRLELHAEPLVMVGAETQLMRAIANLIRNAVEAVDAAGAVTVRSDPVSIPERLSTYETIEPGEYVTVSVSDTGQGIAEADLARIFEPFFSKKRLREQSGSGLGLAIVHGVVKEHGGFLDVVSRVGLGTTFTLFFQRSSAALEPRRALSVAPKGSARILIVDDEPLQLRAARRLLTHLGYEVTTASCGNDAHRLFLDAAAVEPRAAAGSPYDLVIMDVLLNQEDGIEVLERIHAVFPSQRALIASGHAPFDRGRLATERGLLWLTKPYTREALARAVESALGAEPAAS